MKTALKKRGLIVGRKIEARFSAGRCELRHDESKVLGLVKSGESVIVTEWQESVAEIRPIKEKTTQDLISTGTSALAKDEFDSEVWRPSPNPKGLSLLNAQRPEIKH